MPTPALETWQNPSPQKLRRRCDELGRIIHQQEQNIQFLETKALHLIISYIATQLLIFLWASSPGLHGCSKRWGPFSVSIFLAIIFGFSFTTTVRKYRMIKYHQELNSIERNEMYSEMVYAETHGSSASTTSSDADYVATGVVVDVPKESNHQKYDDRRDMASLYVQNAQVTLLAGALSGFTILVLYTCSTCSGSL